MPTFCQAGDIARITFSDGEILQISDSPINIEETINYPSDPNCARYVIYYSWSWPTRSAASRGISSPFGGIRINREAGTSTIQALCRGIDFNCGIYQWYSLGTQSSGIISDLTLDDIRYYPGGGSFPISKTFTISDSDGGVISKIKSQFTTYSVQCIRCPPGTLDCGDCCLPCDDVFNQISEIRNLLSRI